MMSVHLLVAAVLLGSGAQPGPLHSPTDADSPAAIRTEPQRVEITTPDDKHVTVGTYYAPKDQKKLAPAVLLVHDAGGKRGDLAQMAERLQQKGFGVLSIDLRHHGESVGSDKPWTELTDAERQAAWLVALRDVKAAASWVLTQPSIHTSNLSLFGDRAGCTLVTRHATRDENVRSIALLDPPSEQLGFKLARDIAALGGVPTLIAVTKEAETVAQSLADSGQKANNGLQYVEIAVFKGVSLAPVLDKKLPGDIATFLWNKASPKKGNE